ncbi:hypothetical protein MPNT_170043 [Candidatus Methylacidithermus pantelleriae]|uniref:Uncharacterized protein n=1 Tax=Candidatus Methylacidithermus pantelleriae TaxID=2744239 RepID=A0A8J2BSB9_9BACT|nr:hypothetical protein MPNT_170043 [Candidatus Methylacidithermus pantelleriae]
MWGTGLCGVEEKGLGGKGALPGEAWVKPGLELGGREALLRGFPVGNEFSPL